MMTKEASGPEFSDDFSVSFFLDCDWMASFTFVVLSKFLHL